MVCFCHLGGIVLLFFFSSFTHTLGHLSWVPSDHEPNAFSYICSLWRRVATTSRISCGNTATVVPRNVRVGFTAEVQRDAARCASHHISPATRAYHSSLPAQRHGHYAYSLPCRPSRAHLHAICRVRKLCCPRVTSPHGVRCWPHRYGIFVCKLTGRNAGLGLGFFDIRRALGWAKKCRNFVRCTLNYSD